MLKERIPPARQVRQPAAGEGQNGKGPRRISPGPLTLSRLAPYGATIFWKFVKLLLHPLKGKNHPTVLPGQGVPQVPGQVCA